MNKRTKSLILFSLIALCFIILWGYYIDINLDTTNIDLNNSLKSPSLENAAGTDELGRDIFLRVIEGSSLSLRISFLVWGISLIIGIILGTIAGLYSEKLIDTIISGMITYIYATPFIIFLIALLGIIGPGLENAYLTLLLFAWAAPARQTRVIVSNIKNAKFVTASKSFGFSPKEMINFVIIPQVFKPVLISSLAVLPEIIALDAGLSFFGLGVQPPAPSLGKMIADGVNYLSTAWWMSTIPILFLLSYCLCIRYIALKLTGVLYE